MTLADFEARYRSDPDPWGYTTSPYEQAKYAATVAACGRGPIGRAAELGASIGVLSALLADRCEELVTLDASATAVLAARRRLADRPGVTVLEGAIPRALPDGPFDLVLASEILYYLDASELAATLAWAREALRTGGRLVAVHWRPDGPERPLSADSVHAVLAAEPWLALRESRDTDDYRLSVMEAT